MISSSLYDGIPERTFDDWLNTRHELAARTAALAEGTGRHRHERRRQPPTGGKPGRQRKPVICIETGQPFDSVSEAARAIGCWMNALSEALKRGSTCGGYHWQYVGKPPATLAARRLCKPVELIYGDWICGQWPSMEAAALAHGMSRKWLEGRLYPSEPYRGVKGGGRWWRAVTVREKRKEAA